VSRRPVADVDVDDGIEDMPENQLLPCTHTNRRIAPSAFVVRQKFTDYFNTEMFLGKQIAFQEGNTKYLLTQTVSPMHMEFFMFLTL